MPSYAHLARQKLNFDDIQARVNVMAMLGVPYGDAVSNAADMARAQAREIAEYIESREGPKANEIADTKMMAPIAYMQRLGVDLNAPAPTPVEPDTEGGDS